MTSPFRDLLAYILAALSRVLTPAFQRQLVRLCVSLFADLPQLSGAWVIRFAEPGPSGGDTVTAIDAELRQFGRFVRGRGHRQGEPGDPFEYQGVIKRNVLYGSFQRVNANVLAGTGTFVLNISPDSRGLVGHCTWYDNGLDDVWSSNYLWTRKG